MEAVAEGHADLVSYGRLFISNPDLATLVRTVQAMTTDWQRLNPAVLSPDGAWLYYPQPGSLVRVRTSDGQVMDRVRIPINPGIAVPWAGSDRLVLLEWRGPKVAIVE